MKDTIHGAVTVDAIGPGYTDDPGDPKSGKPYLRLTFFGGPVVYVTAHLADMIGGAGRGATARWNDLQQKAGESS
jgi:hypothetical protein